MNKVQYESEILKASAQEECTKAHKRIMGRPLTNHYTLVKLGYG